MYIYRYELYLPLHELWVSYIEELLQAVGRGEGKGTNQAQMNQRLLKADFHGSIMKGEVGVCTYVQWNFSSSDTRGTEESVLIL